MRGSGPIRNGLISERNIEPDLFCRLESLLAEQILRSEGAGPGQLHMA
jgi:hypothetical protein